VAHRFDVVTVRIVDERAVVIRVVLRAQSRSPVVAAARHDGRIVELGDGGRVGEHGAATGRRITGRFPEEDIPRVIGALAEYYRRERHKGERFGDFVARVGSDRLSEVAGAAAGMVQ
jgi:dissimilatory sulfite reductase (desulfoviridin) alpha/beta subunit